MQTQFTHQIPLVMWFEVCLHIFYHSSLSLAQHSPIKHSRQEKGSNSLHSCSITAGTGTNFMVLTQ